MLLEEKQKKLIAGWGDQMQINCAIEEMAELTQALIKHKRGKGNRTNIIEEIADVEVTLDQLKLIFNVSQMDIDFNKKIKIERALDRLDKGEN